MNMTFSTAIYQAAQLGTAKQSALPPLPAHLNQAAVALQGKTAESIFYQISSLALAYDRVTRPLPPRATELQPPSFTPDAPKALLSEAAQMQLLQWLAMEHDTLHEWALAQVQTAGFGLSGALYVELFQEKHNTLRRRLWQTAWGKALLGAQGVFMAEQLGAMAELAGADDFSENFDFERETTAKRVAWLSWMRQKDPARAREILQQTWKSDGADVREKLLLTFKHGLSLDDEAFLQSALEKDRSSRVREVAMNWLEILPSAHSQKLEAWFMARVSYADGKWQHTPQAFDLEMKKFGFEEISRQKGESDENFIVRQLMFRLRPDFYATFFGVDEGRAVQILLQQPPVKLYDQRYQWQRWSEHFGTPSMLKALLSRQIDDDNVALLVALSAEEREAVLCGATYQASGFKALNAQVSPNEQGVKVQLSRYFFLPTEQDVLIQWGQEYTQFALNVVKNRHYCHDSELIALILHSPEDDATEQAVRRVLADKSADASYFSVFEQKSAFRKALFAS